MGEAAPVPQQELYIPELPDSCTTVQAALLYAEAGWYIGPTKPESKHPGSLLGNKWPQQSTRNLEQIEEWFTGERKSKRGIFLHVGKSGAIVFDLDNISRVPKHLARACAQGITDGTVPYQTTRVMRAVEEAHGYTLYRGHYLFKMPPGRVIGNSVPKAFGRGWGEVRGYNGVIIAEPSIHAEADNGGRYQWQVAAPLPALPADTERLLKDYVAGSDTDLDAKELKAWKADLPSVASDSEPCRAMVKALGNWKANIGSGAHDSLRDGSYHMVLLAMEGHPGLTESLKELYQMFLDEMSARRGADSTSGSWSPSEGSTGKRVISEADAQNEAHRIILGAYARGIGAAEEGKPIATRCACWIGSNDSEIQLQLAPIEYEWTEEGLSQMYLDSFGDRLKYIPELGRGGLWVVHQPESNLWKPGNATAMRMSRKITSMLKDAADEMHEVAVENGDDNDVQTAASFRTWAKQTRTRAKRENLVAMSAIDEKVEFSVDQLDVGNILADRNGMVADFSDFKQVKIRPLEKEDFATMATHAPISAIGIDELPKTHRGSSVFIDYLDIFLPDSRLRAYAQKIMGYTLLNGNPSRLIIFLFGGTSTGKSTIMETIMAAAGGYSSAFDTSLLKAKQEAGPRADIVDVLRRRIIGTAELNSAWHLHGDMIKKLTGGDTISANPKFANEFIKRVPSFTPVIATNQTPTIDGADLALKRRLRVLPFLRTISQRDEKSWMLERMRSDYGADEKGHGGVLEAAMAWMLEGTARYLREGLEALDDCLPVVREETARFIGGMNQVELFMHERCVFGHPSDGFMVKPSMLYEAYREWCYANHIPERDIMSNTAFGTILNENGFTRGKGTLEKGGKQTDVRRGIRLRKATE